MTARERADVSWTLVHADGTVAEGVDLAEVEQRLASGEHFWLDVGHPEGDDLDYDWYVNGTKVGTGVVLSYTVPGTGTRTVNVQLKVYDPAGLEGVSVTKAVTVS